MKKVRLMPAQYVKAYVKRQKNDMADAEAICEAVARAKHAVWRSSHIRGSRTRARASLTRARAITFR